jgi:hypothetical protein
MAAPATLFATSRLKLQRATDHIKELASNISAYAARKPVFITVKPHVDPQYRAWEMACTEGAPAYLSAIIGDAIHNLRATLDLMAVELVRLNGGNEDNVLFPFAQNANELETMIRRRHLDRAAPEVVDLIRSLKPYIGGNVALRYVHDLDIMDKHQMIIPAAVYATFFGNGFGMDRQHLTPRMLGGGMYMRNEHMDAIFTLGTHPVSIRLEFPLGGPLAGKEITEALHSLAMEFSGILDSFELFCSGAVSK